MNSVRKTEAWTAYDGSMHTNERDAILASINTILGINGGAFSVLVDAAFIEKNLKALMPLFQRLLDPRNIAPKPAPVAIDTRTFEDLREPEVLRDGGDMLTIVDAAADEGANEALHPGARIIEPDDLRVGQLVETRDGWGLLIEQITCDNEPQPVVVGMAAPDDETTPTRLTIALDDIIQIIKQPEDMMSKEDAERRLKEMSDEEIELKPDDPRRTQIHKSRILLMRRLERLRNGDDE